MMNIGPEQAARMDLWTYQALMHNWNKAHSTEATAKPLDPVKAARLERAIEANALN